MPLCPQQGGESSFCGQIYASHDVELTPPITHSQGAEHYQMCVLWLLSEALIVDTCLMQREAGGHEDMMDAGGLRNNLLSVSQPLKKKKFKVFYVWIAAHL